MEKEVKIMFVETIHLFKEYFKGENKCTALNDVNLKIENPGLYALKGPSGSGKTSLLNIIGHIDHATRGQVRVLDQELNNMNDYEATNFRLQNLGYVFQQFNLIPVLTGSENIEYPLLETSLTKKEKKERLQSLIETLKIKDFVNKKPKNLSGGEQQRIAIARSLINNPKIIMADEPTANLDAENVHNILKIFQTLVSERNLLILISTHDQRVVDMCSRTYNLRYGHLDPNN